MPISRSLFHVAQYYETDSMKIVHHANYVKWMEEARLNYFKEIGFDWKSMESKMGIMIPVLAQSVEYKNKIEFDELVEVVCICEKFNGIKMNFHYKFLTNEGRSLNAFGYTKHGFIDKSFKPISLKEEYYEGYNIIDRALKEE